MPWSLHLCMFYSRGLLSIRGGWWTLLPKKPPLTFLRTTSFPCCCNYREEKIKQISKSSASPSSAVTVCAYVVPLTLDCKYMVWFMEHIHIGAESDYPSPFGLSQSCAGLCSWTNGPFSVNCMLLVYWLFVGQSVSINQYLILPPKMYTIVYWKRSIGTLHDGRDQLWHHLWTSKHHGDYAHLLVPIFLSCVL